MVTDACQAMANAIKKCFPNCKIIMCFFHVKTNIRKKKHKLIPKHKYFKLNSEKKIVNKVWNLNSLHFKK